MIPLVLDCSVTMAWCFEDEAGEYAECVLDTVRSRTALVPTLWDLEVVNTLLSALRRGRLEVAKAAPFLDALAALPIQREIEPETFALERFFHFAHRHGLTAYDVAYLDLAARHGAPLATLDAALRKACRAAGVKVFTGNTA